MNDELDKPTVLIVDDDPTNIQALERLLERRDRLIITAPSGKAALKWLLEREVALILLDVRMPEMDGYETAALIRQREKTQDVPILFLTAFNKEDVDVMKGYSFGAVDYIFKPIVPQIVCAKVDVFVELHRKTATLQYNNEVLARTKRELLQTNQELAELNKLKSSFVSVASHEIRTPVTGIKSYVDNMLDGLTGPLTDKQRHYLTRVASNVERLMKIIDELLDLARIEAGQLQLQMSSIVMTDLIDDVTEACRALAVEKKICLRQVTDAISGISLNADEGKLYQVLTNLIHNALKFTPAGGHVEIEAFMKDSAHMQICVRDTGPGIPPSELTKIFEKFYSAPSAPPGTRGAGLGLTISKSLVDLHGGNLWVSSSDQGSRFYVDLPHAQQQ